MQRQFIYTFVINNNIEWSAETKATFLKNRMSDIEEDDKEYLEDFLKTASPGDHMTFTRFGSRHILFRAGRDF